MTTTVLAELRRADAIAKTAYRAAQEGFTVIQRNAEANAIATYCGQRNVPADVKALGANIAAQERTLGVLLEVDEYYLKGQELVRKARDEMEAAALNLQIALDAIGERRLLSRERLTEVLAIAFNVPAVDHDEDGAILDEIADTLVEAQGDSVVDELAEAPATTEDAKPVYTIQLASGEVDQVVYEEQPSWQITSDADVDRLEKIVKSVAKP